MTTHIEKSSYIYGELNEEVKKRSYKGLETETSKTNVNNIENTISVDVKLNLDEIREEIAKKQDTLVSGKNIKTINEKSILGEGNLDIPIGEWGYIAGNIDDQEDLQLLLRGKSDVSHVHDSRYYTKSESDVKLSQKQDKLISGSNIKTINNNSLLGSGNIDITSAEWGNIKGEITSQTDLQNQFNTKQNTLISGQNIKTINGEDITGSGNIKITSGEWGKITGNLPDQTDLNSALSGKASVVHTHTAEQVSGLATVATSGSYNDLNDKPVIPDISTKMDKADAVGTGSFSINRKEGTTVGTNSVTLGTYNEASGSCSQAEGLNTIASAMVSHAEGRATEASGTCSHAEGLNTQASNTCSHAEGSYSIASGQCSHAEGNGTEAIAADAHAEGKGTIASGEQQHVQGKFNISDSTYVQIIGNGDDDSNRSNAHTINWDGTAWFANDVYVKSTSGTNKDGGSKKLATEEQVELKYTKPTSGIPKTDLSSEAQTSLSKADTAIQSHQDISGKENISNKTTSWPTTASEASNDKYPSEKLVFDTIGNVEAVLVSIMGVS